MGSHVLLVNGGRWTKKQSHPATRLLFCPGETYVALPGIPSEYPNIPISQYPIVSASLIRYACSICQRGTNGTGLRVRATLTM